LASGESLHSPRFSPSGRWIAFQDNGDNRWLVRSDGQAGTALDAGAAAWLPREDLALLRQDGVFAPDGRRYVFSRDLATDDGQPSVGQLCFASFSTSDRATPDGESDIPCVGPKCQETTLRVDTRREVGDLLE
jgi:hypothetical protein